METLLDAIKAGIATDASPEARAAAAQACRTLIDALDASTGQPLAAPVVQASSVASMVGALRGVPPEQLLDLAIAKLRSALPPDAPVAPVRPLKFHIVSLPRRT